MKTGIKGICKVEKKYIEITLTDRREDTEIKIKRKVVVYDNQDGKQ